MTALQIEAKSGFLRASGTTTGTQGVRLKVVPDRYVDDLRRARESAPNLIDLGAEFALYGDESLEWAESTLPAAADSWPKA